MKRINYILIIIIAAAMGCKKPYAPPAITSATSYLVVEGVINTGSDSTIINLSRTVGLTGTVTKNPQTRATVTVESDQNGSYPLTETAFGKYISPGLNLDVTRQYRLRIKTLDNQQYLSDFVAAKVTPPIDSIGFTVASDGLQIYANAHDPQNSTHYYRWDYFETWEFHSKYLAIDPPYSQKYYCWGNNASSDIVLGSSAKLGQDVIYQNPITSIISTSEKIEFRYSILVHQYALTSDAYTFWVNLKKDTEELGSIFDSQPSSNIGNIHNINNPGEPVIGYVSACTIQTKRIYIDESQLPQTWQPTYPYNCPLDSQLYSRPGSNGSEIPVFLAYDTHGNLVGDLATSIDCVNCTIRGNIKPPVFWKFSTKK